MSRRIQKKQEYEDEEDEEDDDEKRSKREPKKKKKKKGGARAARNTATTATTANSSSSSRRDANGNAKGESYAGNGHGQGGDVRTTPPHVHQPPPPQQPEAAAHGYGDGAASGTGAASARPPAASMEPSLVAAPRAGGSGHGSAALSQAPQLLPMDVAYLDASRSTFYESRREAGSHVDAVSMPTLFVDGVRVHPRQADIVLCLRDGPDHEVLSRAHAEGRRRINLPRTQIRRHHCVAFFQVHYLPGEENGRIFYSQDFLLLARAFAQRRAQDRSMLKRLEAHERTLVNIKTWNERGTIRGPLNLALFGGAPPMDKAMEAAEVLMVLPQAARGAGTAGLLAPPRTSAAAASSASQLYYGQLNVFKVSDGRSGSGTPLELPRASLQHEQEQHGHEARSSHHGPQDLPRQQEGPDQHGQRLDHHGQHHDGQMGSHSGLSFDGQQHSGQDASHQRRQHTQAGVGQPLQMAPSYTSGTGATQAREHALMGQQMLAAQQLQQQRQQQHHHQHHHHHQQQQQQRRISSAHHQQQQHQLREQQRGDEHFSHTASYGGSSGFSAQAHLMPSFDGRDLMQDGGSSLQLLPHLHPPPKPRTMADTQYRHIPTTSSHHHPVLAFSASQSQTSVHSQDEGLPSAHEMSHLSSTRQMMSGHGHHQEPVPPLPPPPHVGGGNLHYGGETGAYGTTAYRTPLASHGSLSSVLRGSTHLDDGSSPRSTYSTWQSLTAPGSQHDLSASAHLREAVSLEDAHTYGRANPSMDMRANTLPMDVSLGLPSEADMDGTGAGGELGVLPHGVDASPGADSEPSSKRKQLAPVRGNTDGSGAPPAKVARLGDQ
jgi:hypothetical protein